MGIQIHLEVPMNKIAFVLILPFLLIFVSAPVYADDFQDGVDATVRGDYRTDFEKVKLRAEQGNAGAQCLVGNSYESGAEVPRNYKEAVKWWRLSAEQDNAEAQLNLGRMYRQGNGVPQDYEEVVKWFRKPAEQGDAFAQYYLGLMYAEGKGVPRDYVQAHKWFNISEANEDKLGHDNRNNIEKRMTSEQVAEAQRLAREWMRKHRKD